jgi:hypothetical protein
VTFPAGNRLRGAGAALAAVLALLLFSAPPAHAQQLLQGRVVRAADSAGLGRVRVTLHRVTRRASGPVDSTLTAPDGSFRVTLPPAEADAAGGGFNVFFATAEVEGVRYFGRALHAGDPLAGYRVVAYDTTSRAAYADSVRVSRRDVAMIPEEQGGWEVGEIVRLVNFSHRTIVPAAGPILSLGLPEGATSFEVGEGELGKQEVLQMRGRVYIAAPLPPGGRELFVRYRILKGRTRAAIPVTLPTDTLNVFVRQPAASARVAGLRGPRPFLAEGERYAQWLGFHLPKGAPVVLTWRNPFASPVDPKLAALILTAAILLAGLVLALRRGRRTASSSASIETETETETGGRAPSDESESGEAASSSSTGREA